MRACGAVPTTWGGCCCGRGDFTVCRVRLWLSLVSLLLWLPLVSLLLLWLPLVSLLLWLHGEGSWVFDNKLCAPVPVPRSRSATTAPWTTPS